MTKDTATIRHGRLSITVPSDWSDESILQFVAPPQEQAAAPMSAKPGGTFRSNVTLRVRKKPGNVKTPEEYLSALVAELKGAGAEVQEMGKGEMPFAGQPGAYFEHRIGADGRLVRQIEVAAFVDDVVIMATAATSETAHKTEIPRLKEVLSSSEHRLMDMRRIAIGSVACLIVAVAVVYRHEIVGSPASDVSPLEEDELLSAWADVRERPRDPDAWIILGDAHAARGHLQAAEHAYETALNAGSAGGLAHARLGFLRYEQQREAEALALLQEAKRRGADVPMLDWTIDALGELGSEGRPDAGSEPLAVTPGADAGRGAVARSPGPPGTAPPPVMLDAGATFARVAGAPEVEDNPLCEIPLDRLKSGALIINLLIDGAEAALIVDTGASLTVLTRDFVESLGVPLDHQRAIEAITANGRVTFPTAVMGEIVVQDHIVENVRVAVCPNCVQSVADGLFGLDLVGALGLDLDVAEGIARLSGCATAE